MAKLKEILLFSYYTPRAMDYFVSFLSRTAAMSLNSCHNGNRAIISSTFSPVDGICDGVHFVGFQEISTLGASNYVEYENEHL